NAALRTSVHAHFDARLMYSCSVGGTHWSELGGAKGLAGPRPVLFFAPAQAKKRQADWGGHELGRRMAAAWTAFMRQAGAAEAPWCRIVRGHGPEAVQRSYAALLDGTLPASEGHVLSL
ncbi:MAG TPA: DUF2855 family protein, partial [Albitalea sp.]|nr:DUF2855 family protein [Albitalea sp.]